MVYFEGVTGCPPIKILVGGKSGLLQGGWFLTGTGSDTWKVPQKTYRSPYSGE